MRAGLELAELVVERVREEFAPDPRLAVFDVLVQERDGGIALVGATSEIDAAQALHQRVAEMNAWRMISDEVIRLPEAHPEEAMHALVTAAVAPMLAAPRIAQTQVSQAVLGSRLLVLRRLGRWLQCRSTDGYIGWVHAGYVGLVDEAGARAWELGNGGETWISLGADLRDGAGETIVRLPWGARVVRESADAARLPDGRRGRPVGELVPAGTRSLAFPPDGEAVCQTAAQWLGAPYLWGGVTAGGVDCSGFVQSIFRLHGVQLPRDADLQSQAGEAVDAGDDLERLLPGDLLFFAEEPGRCTHVTLSTGGSQIIHSSLGNGGVARNDLNGRRNYEKELRRLFLFARRVL